MINIAEHLAPYLTHRERDELARRMPLVEVLSVASAAAVIAA